MIILATEYALCTARQTAQRTGGPINHLTDVFNERGKPGLVQSRRGSTSPDQEQE